MCIRVSGVSLSDSDEFRAFYEEAAPFVYGYFMRRCGGRSQLAEDLTSEVFVSAVRAVRGGVVVDAPMPWIMTIARRRLVDHYRRRDGRRDLGLDEAPTVSVGSVWDSPSEARLVTALERLSSNHRAVLVLRFVDGLPVREVGELMGRSERAAESLLVRARAALRAEWEEAEDA